MTLDWG